MKNINISTMIALCITIVVVLLISVFVILYLQKKMFFHPWHDEASYENLKLIEGFEELKIPNNNEYIMWRKRSELFEYGFIL